MRVIVTLSLLFTMSLGGLIEHNEKATSYQSFHMEHFHPVPTYIKKEHHKLHEHPISIGKTSNKIEIHHGDKHDPGYAIKHEDHEESDFGGGFGEELKGFEEHKGFEGGNEKLEIPEHHHHHQQPEEEVKGYEVQDFEQQGLQSQDNQQQAGGHQAVFNWEQLQHFFAGQQPQYYHAGQEGQQGYEDGKQ